MTPQHFFKSRATMSSSYYSANQKSWKQYRPCDISGNYRDENAEGSLATELSSNERAIRRSLISIDIVFNRIKNDRSADCRQTLPRSSERITSTQERSDKKSNKGAAVALGAILIAAIFVSAASTVSKFLNRLIYTPTDNRSPKIRKENWYTRGNLDAAVATSKEPEYGLELYGIQRLADLSAPRTANETPVFWHITRCGGASMKLIMGKCFGLTLAAEGGEQNGHQNDRNLEVFTNLGIKYVNVDPSYKQGIERARELGLIPSGIANVVASPYLHEMVSLFDISHKGRAFTMMRHPVERAVSMYYYLQKIDPAMANVPLIDWARGKGGIENNWMVRYLVNQIEGDIALDLAKIVLKRKFLIGILEEKEESIKRFQSFFGWEKSDDSGAKTEAQSFCVSRILDNGINTNSDGYHIPKKGTQEYSLIAHQNQFDIKLYNYAKELFDEQTSQFGSESWKRQGKKLKLLKSEGSLRERMP